MLLVFILEKHRLRTFVEKLWQVLGKYTAEEKTGVAGL